MTDEPASPPLERDDLSRGMDRWQAECRRQLMSEYGHPWDSAVRLAWHMRLMLEADLRKSMPLIVIAGV